MIIHGIYYNYTLSSIATYETTLEEIRLQQEKNTTNYPYLFLVEHKSYHNVITGEEAEQRLIKHCETRCYLTRFSQRQGHNILTVCDLVPRGETVEYKMKHFIIKFKEHGIEQKYWIHEKSVFTSIDELLQFYENHRIHPGLSNIGKCLVHNNNAQLSEQYERQRNSLTIALSSANRIDIYGNDEICCNCTCKIF